MGPLASNLIHYQDECRAAWSFSICLYDITSCLYSSPFTAASCCCTVKIDGTCMKEGHLCPLWEFIILQAEGERNRARCSLGIPSAVVIFPSSKKEQEECWPRSRVSETKHNTAFIAGRHLHNARMEKKCTFLNQLPFQYYGNAHLKWWIEGSVLPMVQLCYPF